MKAVRWLLALLLVAATIAVIERRVLPRLQCNRDKARIQAEAKEFENTGDEYLRTTRARRNIEACRRCVERVPADYEMWFLLGVNQRVLQLHDEALRSFRQALALNERPETYAEIALLELERGNVDEARALLVKAAMFNMMFSEYVSNPLRREIYVEVLRKQKQLQTGGGA
jgi:tetratricopeptide (TPR) repeat protein